MRQKVFTQSTEDALLRRVDRVHEFRTSCGQCVEGDNAINRHRDVMGATNPAQAAEGTIRKDFALSIGENTVHGSDAPETAATEIAYFFAATEIVNSAGRKSFQ